MSRIHRGISSQNDEHQHHFLKYTRRQSCVIRGSSTMSPLPKNLAELDAEALAEFFDSFDHVLSDCDGVIYIIYDLIEGVKLSIEALKKLGKTVAYVTNNSTKSRENIAAGLRMRGVEVEKEDVINPARATADYLKNIGFKKKAYVIGMQGIRCELEEAGFEIANPYKPELYLSDDTLQFFKDSRNLDPDVGAVIVCMDINTTYIMLDKACRYLENPDVIFIATGAYNKVPIYKDFQILGSGYFQGLISKSSGRDYINLGKPARRFQEYLKRNIRRDPKRTLFVGDVLDQDINFANELGYQSLLVLTGGASLEDAMSAEGICVPNYYINSFGDLHKLIEKAQTVKKC